MHNMMGMLITLGAMVAVGSGSAIPMWEFLGREEKMSHLYSMFAKQVSAHCKSAAIEMPVALCKRDLLVYGIGRLERMSDAYLDAMDPYQRGVNDLIWDAMVEGHSSKPAKRVHHVTQTPIREPSAGSYEHNPLFDDVSTDNNRHQPYASSADNDHLNEATASSASSSSSYASDMDAMYDPVPQRSSHRQHQNTNNNHQRTRIQQQQLESQSQPDAQYVLPDASNVRNIYAAADILPSPYLSGPMIIRVRPDGTPVEEDSRRQLPRDDDREAMTIGREKLPTAEQIASEFGSGSYRTAVRMY